LGGKFFLPNLTNDFAQGFGLTAEKGAVNKGDFSMVKNQVKGERSRQNHNEDLIRRMRDGEPLTSFDSTSSWYPPRPIIKKDPKALQALYGKKDRRSLKQAPQAAKGELREIADKR